MPSQITSRAIVLSRTNFAEADRILSVITPDYGKVRLMARGVRKVRSKLAGGIELFSISQISFIVGRGEIRTLTSSRLEKHFGNIAKDVERTMFGYEVLKLIDRVTEDEAGEEYFEVLDSVLEALNSDTKIDLIKLWLYLHLLRLGGHQPNLKTDSENNNLEEKKKYNFDFEAMAFAENQTGRYSAKHIKLIRLGDSSNSPARLAKIQQAEKETTEAIKLVELVAKQYLNINTHISKTW